MDDYWQKQTPDELLFGDTLWQKPERRDQAGRLAIVGGNSQGFWAVAAAYQTAQHTGVGQVRVIIPGALNSRLPRTIITQIDDLVTTPSNPSGGLAIGAEKYLTAATAWSNNILLVGDNGANSETAQLLERFVLGADKSSRITITRDSVDLLVHGAESVLSGTNCTLVVSLGQFQKLARAVFYPRIISFSQGLKQIVETLHKFTISYPATIILFHNDNLIVANHGRVVSQPFNDPIRVWNGEIAARAASWSIWAKDPLRAIATSWAEL